MSEGKVKLALMYWFEGDFWSQRTRQLSDVARLMYRSVLQQAWQCPTAPYIPNNDMHLRFLADCSRDDLWQQYGPELRSMFVETEDGKYLINDRLEREYETALSKAMDRSSQARKAAMAMHAAKGRKPASSEHAASMPTAQPQASTEQSREHASLKPQASSHIQSQQPNPTCSEHAVSSIDISHWIAREIPIPASEPNAQAIAQSVDSLVKEKKWTNEKAAEFLITKGRAYKRSAAFKGQYKMGWAKFFTSEEYLKDESHWGGEAAASSIPSAADILKSQREGTYGK